MITTIIFITKLILTCTITINSSYLTFILILIYFLFNIYNKQINKNNKIKFNYTSLIKDKEFIIFKDSLFKQKNKISKSVFSFNLKFLFLISGILLYGILIYLNFLVDLSLVSDGSWNSDNLACYSNSEPTGPTGPTGPPEPTGPTGSTEPGALDSLDWFIHNFPNTFPTGREIHEIYIELGTHPLMTPEYMAYARSNSEVLLYFYYYKQAKWAALSSGLSYNSRLYDEFIHRYTNHNMRLYTESRNNTFQGHGGL